MGGRKLFSRKDWPGYVLLILLLAGVVFWLERTPQGHLAVLELDGQVAARRDLATLAGPEQLTVTGESGIPLTVEFSPNGARFVSAGCPDKTCQRTGTISRAGETAVCLPGRAVLRIEGQPEHDAETY